MTARRARAHLAAATGTTLVELLVAITLLSLAVGTVAMLATAVLAGFEADPAAADAQQRGRSGLNLLVDDVLRAGSGFVHAPDDGPGVGLPPLVADAGAGAAWVMGAAPNTLTTIAGRRGAAHAQLRSAAAAGDVWLRLARPAFCPAAASACGFASGDDVLLFDRHGRVALAAIAQVVAPFDLELTRPLLEPWPLGASVSSAIVHGYAMRPDAATGLQQLVRRLGDGPATPVIDYVTRFDVTWHAGAAAPFVRLAPDGTEEDATAGPRPPAPGVVGDPAWPPGENCAFARDAAGRPVWRGSTGPVTLPVLSDGPWCPSAAASSRWDVDLARVERVTLRLDVAVASTRLRSPASVITRVAGARVVPDLTLTTDVVPGRRNGGG